MTEPDELYTLRNMYWNGCYQSAINESNGLRRVPPHLAVEKTEYLYRSYLALKQYDIVLGEISDEEDTPQVLKAIKLMAQVETNTTEREHVVKVLREWLISPSADNTPASNASLQLFTALLLMQEGNTKDAVKTLQSGNSLEQKALLVQLYLKMDRADVAAKVLKAMVSTDEDSSLTQIASAWLHMANGKSVEATYIFDELSDKHGESSLLKNGSAVAKMQLGEFADAESLLQDSLRTNPNDPDTLANLIAVSQHLNKAPEVVNRYLKQLQNVSPSHQLVLSLATFEQAFDRVAATFAKGTKV